VSLIAFIHLSSPEVPLQLMPKFASRQHLGSFFYHFFFPSTPCCAFFRMSSDMHWIPKVFPFFFAVSCLAAWVVCCPGGFHYPVIFPGWLRGATSISRSICFWNTFAVSELLMRQSNSACAKTFFLWCYMRDVSLFDAF